MTCLQNGYEPNSKCWREFAQATLLAIQGNYGRLISEARKEWERKFANSDPSDACVTVRINGRDSRKFARLFPLEFSLRLKSFVTN
jgi:hypothetical protein